MKLRNIFTIFASLLALAFTSCEVDESRFLDEVKVSQSYIAIPAEGKTVEITVDAVDSWEITGIPEWLTVNPAKGSAGQTVVKFTAGPATSTNEAQLKLTCAGATQVLNVIQMTEKVEPPMSTCKEVINGEDGVVYRVKGTVTSIVNTEYGNWYLEDETGSVYVYGTLYEGATKQFLKHGLEVGDIVTVEGPRKDYSGTIELVDVTVIEIEKSLIKVESVEIVNNPEEGAETPEDTPAEGEGEEEAPTVLSKTGGSVIVTLTAKGDGVSVVVPEDAKSWLSVAGLTTSGTTAVVTFDAAANQAGDRTVDISFLTTSEGVEYSALTTIAQKGSILNATIPEFLAAAEDATLYRISGNIKSLSVSDQYHNANVTIVDGAGNEAYLYRLVSNEKNIEELGLKEGDYLTVVGKRSSYNGSPQMAQGCYIESYVSYVPATISEFLAAEVSDVMYRVSGVIVNIKEVSAQYGNANLTIADDAGNELYIYRMKPAEGGKAIDEIGFKEGDVLTVVGKRSEYNGSPQMGSPIYVSHEAGAAVEYSLDGKQWIAEMDGMQVLLDFGLAEEGMLAIARPTMDGTGFGLYMAGIYEIQKTDAVSGVVSGLWYDWENEETYDEFEIPYSELGEASVKLVCETVFGISDPVAFTAVENPYEIQVEGSGDSPEGAIPNGDYWFTNGGKVMAPMAEGATSGVMPANDLINGASTAKNIFTLTYDPDMSYYTIQDSYGRYLGNESWGNDISLTTVLPSGEDYSYYLWSVETGFDDGTFDIYNAASYNGFAYSAADNNWYLDPVAYETDGVRPTLVLAENPVDEPEPEESEVLTLTNAEICAAMTASNFTYSEYTIESESGVWTVNASRSSENTFLQCRGKKGGYIKTPAFEKDIKSVTIHFTDKKSVYADNTYCVFPSTWTAPTADAAYPEDGNVGKAVTDGSYSLTIPVDAGNKQVYISIIGTYAYYLDHIDVEF